MTLSRRTLVKLGLLALGAPQPEEREDAPATRTLGLEQGFLALEAPGLTLKLVRASQTVAALEPLAAAGFDFTPGDWLEKRAADGFFHLGDLTLRVRSEPGAWRSFSTAEGRRPVETLPVAAPVLAAADLAATLPSETPLRVRRYWEVRGGHLALRFELFNRVDVPVVIGALGIPLVFNNILHDRSLDEAHARCSFSDPYIGADAGYVQVVRLNGHGPVLLVVPDGATPLEAYRPLLCDRTRRDLTFEGFYEWMAHSRAYAENEWHDAEPWNTPTTALLAPGETRSWGVRFLLADSVRAIEPTLLANARPVAVGIPGYVLPRDLTGRLFLKHTAGIESIRVEPPGALDLVPREPTPGGWAAYAVEGRGWGRARVTVRWADGTRQTVHYKVIDPAVEVVSKLGRFLTTEQWFERPDDPFGRSPSVISYDLDERQPVTQDNRVFVAGLSDEGGAGAWLAAVTKQLLQPDPGEIAKLERFIDGVLWGGLQYNDGALKYGVRKSLFYWEPEAMPPGTYAAEQCYGGWSSWNRQHARSAVRSYNYPHVAAAHWVLYRLARNHAGLVSNHPWDWYLERAFETGVAMTRHAAELARFGQMEGTVFLAILLDLQREGWTEAAGRLEAAMKQRADLWRSLGYPFGSEMPWDSTGQEEVYAWSRYFGYEEKAAVTLDAILAYTPTLPHWGYNGSARRYWDFIIAGKVQRLERQLHHYGSALNALPLFAEYRDHPGDLHLLRVAYGGVLGAIANVTQEGFGPCGFHAFPSTLRIDAYSGDYGSGFLGHALGTATYLVRHPELGWLAFGGEVGVQGESVRVWPRDSARSRLYVAPLGLWLTLDAGAFESLELAGNKLRVTLAAATPHTPVARLRIDQPAEVDGVGAIRPSTALPTERGAFVMRLGEAPTELLLQVASSRDAGARRRPDQPRRTRKGSAP